MRPWQSIFRLTLKDHVTLAQDSSPILISLDSYKSAASLLLACNPLHFWAANPSSCKTLLAICTHLVPTVFCPFWHAHSVLANIWGPQPSQSSTEYLTAFHPLLIFMAQFSSTSPSLFGLAYFVCFILPLFRSFLQHNLNKCMKLITTTFSFQSVKIQVAFINGHVGTLSLKSRKLIELLE